MSGRNSDNEFNLVLDYEYEANYGPNDYESSDEPVRSYDTTNSYESSEIPTYSDEPEPYESSEIPTYSDEPEPYESSDESVKSHDSMESLTAFFSTPMDETEYSFMRGAEASIKTTNTDHIVKSPLHVPLDDTEMIPVPATDQPVAALPPSTEEQVATCPIPPSAESPMLRNGAYENNATRPAERERLTSRSERKSDSERDPLRYRGGSGSPPPRGRSERSRSRSIERRNTARRSRSRSRRSRSRGRERDRSRAWRNRSPPRSRYDRDRKMRSWSKSPPTRSRSRTPPAKLRSRYRNRTKSRSHSPYDSAHGASPHDSNHGDEMRSSVSLQSVVHSTKRRCRDYDEKGFCMRGEMCPYDHGKDPVVLEDVGQVLNFSAPGLPPTTLEPPVPPMVAPGMNLHHRPPINLVEYNPDAPSMDSRMWSKQPFRTSAGRSLLQRGGMMRAPLALGFPPHHQRELISVPVGEENAGYYHGVPNPMKRQCPPDFSNDAESVPVKQRFDYSRLGPRGRGGNCSLQLKKVPKGLNNIAHLHNHFYKFGKIVNIQVSFEGDPEAALITFTSHAEASAAYKSTEAVLNNRFIKVFWYNPDKDNKQENISPLARPSAKERLGAQMNVNAPPVTNMEPTNEMEKVLISGANITKTVYIPTALDRKPALPIPPSKRLMVTTFNNQAVQGAQNALKKKQEEKRKEALKLTQHLSKRKNDLIDEVLLNQKLLMDKLEKGNLTPEKRAEIMATLKGFQENIETLRKDFEGKTVSNNPVKVTPQLVKRSREEVGDSLSSPPTTNMQKQLLDAELDLFNQQQEGKDTTELQKRVIELKTKAHSLGLLTNNGVLRLSRGGARYRTVRGRGGFNPHSTVDHRPTKLLVSGFESDDKAEVLQHFTKFGEVADHIWDEATPALVIQFKTRKDAETAMAKGRNFQDRLLSVTWFNSAPNMGMRNSRSVILLNDTSMSDLLSEHEDEDEALRLSIDQNEDLLLQDEEEEEDEERSWRR
ncbi:RNA-binding protein 26-like isoform X2 [Macrosteles quadrilineatus]|uniref:RNA-binding protein 26-like isoform X2 n=1 Tax=Macrosteles quadrilineatus TaxID=74068 RepID=UPI0023E21548|nr:RNA-binding protein 26-like isoform X2 [Macrosteles quadrilineatus]